MDPIGQSFSVLDPDADNPISEAEVLSHPELEGTYPDVAALLEAVAGSRAFAECFSRHWLGFFLEQPLASLDESWVGVLADSVEAGASLGDVVEQTVAELYSRSELVVPWCAGE
jgi:hypothetical protein